jgi:hypothetical protein
MTNDIRPANDTPLRSAAPAPRTITAKTRASAPAAGFAGPGHTVVQVFDASAFARANPFVLLMDDRLDFAPGQAVGEPHPHAGLETVTLLIEGSLDTGDEGLLETGDAAWMTAGRGLVHNEGVKATGRARVLQLWIMLPKAERSADPELQIIHAGELPVRREPGAEARLYSGSTGTLHSPTRNRVPVTMVDFALEPNAAIVQDVPSAYSGFLYVIDGAANVGSAHLEATDVGWIGPDTGTSTHLNIQAGEAGARIVLYVGEPQDERIIQRGPFVAGSDAEVSAFYHAYRGGRFERISRLT